MTTITASPPAASPQLIGRTTKSPSLPPLMTSAVRRTSSNRPTSLAQRRISSYSSQSRANSLQSRPLSEVFPAFHSSLPYALVRDFAYPSTHPLHYGPQPEPSGVASPASEASRRLSDPNVGTWEDSRSQWSATPPWLAEGTYASTTREQLHPMTFNDGGPPYSEDEDLRSPVVTTSRHRKNRSITGERGRSPGTAPSSRGVLFESANGIKERYHPTGTDDLDGPGGEVETLPTATSQRRNPHHRDSNFAKPLQRFNTSAMEYSSHQPVSEVQDEPDDDDDDGDLVSDDGDPRYSKDYSFTIASPDEEMHGKAVALFDFEPEHENELALSEGQVILVSYRHGQGWLVAEDPQTSESGLVPEEFVRLVKHIEGGLNGLQSVDIDDASNAITPRGDNVLSPISNDPMSASTPTPSSYEFGHDQQAQKSNDRESKHPAVQSTFSTSSRDFSPFKSESRRENISPDKDMLPVTTVS